MAKIRKPKKLRFKWDKQRQWDDFGDHKSMSWGAARTYKGKRFEMAIFKTRYKGERKHQYDVLFSVNDSGDILQHNVGSVRKGKKIAEYWLRNAGELDARTSTLGNTALGPLPKIYD